MPVSSPSYFPPNRGDGTVVGITAGTSTTGSRNFLALKGAGANSTASDLFVIGDSSANTGFGQGFQDTCIIIGNNVLGFLGEFSPPGFRPGIVLGHSTLASAQAGSLNNNIWIGCFSAQNWPADPTGGADDTGNIVIGHSALANLAATTDQVKDNTLIGNNVYSGFDTSITGCTAVGANILKGTGVLSNPVQAFTVIGANTFENFSGTCSGAANIVAVGDSIAPSIAMTTVGQNKDLVMIGSQAGAIFAHANDLVLIGSRAAPAMTSGNNQVLIGSRVATHLTTGASNIIIGFQGGAALTIGVQNTLIGTSVAASLTGNTNVIIGGAAGASMTSAGGCVVIGQGTSAFTNASGLTMIGQGAQIAGSGAQGIILGAGAGTDAAGNPNVSFPIFFVGNANNGYLYGDMSQGNLLLGSSNSAQREFGGAGATNVLKLIAGTPGGSAPNGGGYFYSGGANNSLHWVNSAGVDSTLSDAATLSDVTLTAAAPTVAAAQVGYGATTSTTATLGANGAPPAQVAGYLIINVAGTAQKIPYYNA